MPLNEEILMNGAEYCLVTNANEIGDADFVYEIKRDKSEEDICAIISSICKSLKIGTGSVYVKYENGAFVILNNNAIVGRAVTYDKSMTTLIRFYFESKYR